MILGAITVVCMLYIAWDAHRRGMAILNGGGRGPDDNGPGDDPIVDPPQDPGDLMEPEVDWTGLDEFMASQTQPVAARVDP